MPFVFHEQSLVNKVDAECCSSYSETRQSALESVPPSERAGISPCFSVPCRQSTIGNLLQTTSSVTNALFHGSFEGWPDAAANLRGSNPVMLPRGGAIAVYRGPLADLGAQKRQQARVENHCNLLELL